MKIPLFFNLKRKDHFLVSMRHSPTVSKDAFLYVYSCDIHANLQVTFWIFESNE